MAKKKSKPRTATLSQMIESGYVAEYETLTYERQDDAEDSDAAAKSVQRHMITRAVSIAVVTAITLYYAPGHILAYLARDSTVNWGYTPPALPDIRTIALFVAAISATIAIRQVVRITKRAARARRSAFATIPHPPAQQEPVEARSDG